MCWGEGGDPEGQGCPHGRDHLAGEEGAVGAPAGPPAFLPAARCQVEHRGHHVHPAGRLPTLLAPQADADVEDDHEWQLPVWLTRMG